MKISIMHDSGNILFLGCNILRMHVTHPRLCKDPSNSHVFVFESYRIISQLLSFVHKSLHFVKEVDRIVILSLLGIEFVQEFILNHNMEKVYCMTILIMTLCNFFQNHQQYFIFSTKCLCSYNL